MTLLALVVLTILSLNLVVARSDAEQQAKIALEKEGAAQREADKAKQARNFLALKPMAQWRWLERFGHFDGLEQRWDGFGAPGADNRRSFADWLRSTDCDTLVFCETTIDRPGVDTGPECEIHAELKDILAEQQRFHLVRGRELPHHECRIQVWRRWR
jgi:hypothetical protein